MKVNFVGILIRLISDPFCQPPMFGRFKLFFCSVFLFLNFQFAAHAATPVGLDSVGIQQIEGRVFIIHKVAYQETLFSISRRYKVQMSEIQQSNRILKQGLKEGQMLLVPYGQATSSLDSSVPNSSDAAASSETSASTPARDTSSENAVAPGSLTSEDTPSPAPTIPAKNDKTTAAPTVESPATNPTKTAPAVTIQKVKITHKVKSGESLSTIAKKYKVSVAELKSWNSLSSDKLSIGKALKVITKKAVPVKQNGTQTQAEPLVADAVVKEEIKKEEPKVADRKTEIPNETKEVVFVSTKSPSATTNATGDGIFHTVKSGESLFLLAKMYGSSIEELVQWNGLTSNNIKVGQTLQVGRAATTTAAASTNSTASTTTPTASEVVVEEVKSELTVTVPAAEPKQESTAPNTSGGFTNTKESGLAEVIPGTDANKKYLVLHRNAPIGSVIRIKNEENDLTIFARVVGVLPETGDNSKVLIKLSKAAFEQLKGVNTRFPVEILY